MTRFRDKLTNVHTRWLWTAQKKLAKIYPRRSWIVRKKNRTAVVNAYLVELHEMREHLSELRQDIWNRLLANDLSQEHEWADQAASLYNQWTHMEPPGPDLDRVHLAAGTLFLSFNKAVRAIRPNNFAQVDQLLLDVCGYQNEYQFEVRRVVLAGSSWRLDGVSVGIPPSLSVTVRKRE